MPSFERACHTLLSALISLPKAGSFRRDPSHLIFLPWGFSFSRIQRKPKHSAADRTWNTGKGDKIFPRKKIVFVTELVFM